MGKGIIEMAPEKVYEALRNPRLRYTYDNLLKVHKHSFVRRSLALFLF